MRTLTRLFVVVAAIVPLVIVPGCESEVTREAFDQIENGMDMTQVEDILGGAGEPQTSSGYGIGASGIAESQPGSEDTKSYLWGDEQTGVVVKFRGGKVIFKQALGL